jgi:hypothetical protein
MSLCQSQGHLIRLSFFVCFIDLFFVFGDLGFLFSNSLFNYLSQESSIVVAGADPAMSSEA